MSAVESEKKYYLGIPGLLVSKSLKYEDINAGINNYIDTVPALVEAIESNFSGINQKQGRLHYFMHNMDIAMTLLKNVHARYLERDAQTIIRCVKNETSMPMAQKMMKPFISSLLSLSIEMQKAQNSADGNTDISEAETNIGVANNLSAVGGFIEDGDYEKAQGVAEEIKESIPGVDIVKLLDLITAQKYDEAESLTVALKEKYIEAVNQSAGADLSKKILAVDDRPEMLTFVNGVLKNHYKVFCAPSGKVAVKIMEAQNPNLFILDIDMPEMNGFELAEAIRATDNHKKTPIIFLTGNSARDRVDKAIKAGGNDFIVKPASQEILLTKAGKYLNKEHKNHA